MLFELYLYEDSEDLRKEALTIYMYKYILVTKVVTEDSAQTKAISAETHLPVTKSAVKAASGSEKALPPISLQAAAAAVVKQRDPISVEIDTKSAVKAASGSEKALPPISLQAAAAAVVKQRDPISVEIDRCLKTYMRY